MQTAKRRVVIALPFSLLLGLVWGFGKAFYSEAEGVTLTEDLLWEPLGGDIDLCSATLWSSVALLALLAFVVLFLMLCVWDAVRGRAKGREARHFCADRKLSRRVFWGSFAFIAALWVPALLAMWPGGFVSDGPMQLGYLINDGYVDLHWPAAHTLLMYLLFSIGKYLFGTWSAGLTCYCVFQAVILAFSLACAAKKAVEWGVPVLAVLVSELIVALNPVVQAYAFSTVKDALFSAFFLLAFVLFIDMVRSKNVSRKQVALLIAVACLAALMRKQGAYVVLVVMVVALLVRKKIRCGLNLWQIAALGFVPLAASLCFPALVGLFVPTSSDSSREILSVPSQQIARVYALDRGSLSDSQIAELSQYYDLEALEDYVEPIADPAKGALIEDAYSSNKLGYWKLWLSIGSTHFELYLESFLWGSIGYMYPSRYVVNRWTGFPPWNEFSVKLGYGEDRVIKKDTILPEYYQEYLMAGAWDMFAGNQLLTIWVSPALPFYVLLASLALLLYERSWAMLVAWLVPAIYWCSLLLGPVMCNRYSLPLVFCSSVAWLLPFITNKIFDSRRLLSSPVGSA